MQKVNVCCLTKFSFDQKGDNLKSDGFLGRRDWGLFGIPWESMSTFAVVGFHASPQQKLAYDHELPHGLRVTVIGPHKGTARSRVARGIGEMFGIMRAIIRQRRMLRDLDIIFSEFREYTFFEIVLIKLFARKARTVLYFISDFPESNYARHHNIVFKYLLSSLVALSQWVSDDVWFISEHLARKYRLRSTKRWGIVRTSNLSEREIPAGAARQLPSHGPVRLVYVARLEAEKRPQVIVRAMDYLRAAGVPATLVIVGDGAMRTDLEAMARDTGVAADIDFRGYVADRKALIASYRSADISLLASPFEGTPLALIESVSQGVPAVANHFGGAEEVIRDGLEGFLIGPADDEATAKAMAEKISYLRAHPEEYAELSKNCLARAGQFTIESVTAVQRGRMEALVERTA